MSIGFQDIELGQIAPSPLNPRKHFSGQKFDELVASVRQKGVIEPIIVRPVEKKIPFEIVAGERRFKAAAACQLQTIPAIVRELTDDEAYDFMLIENLQREDLTELEEAESFKAYADRHGDTEGKALAIFSMKTGIRPGYIRARIAVLALPKDVLAMWRDGKLKYGHLEQLLRVADSAVRGQFVKLLKTRNEYERIETVGRLKKEIDELQISLGAALFPTKTECAGCRDNSLVQKDLFGFDAGKASCTNPVCFTGKQRAWLTANWDKTSFKKQHKTNGFRFTDEISCGQREEFQDWSGATRPASKCLTCEFFVTIIDPSGKITSKQSCLKPACYRALRDEKYKPSGDKASGKDSAGGRCSWHPRYFRDLFFRTRIPALLEAVLPESQNARTLLLLALANSNSEARAAAAKALGIKGDWPDRTDVALAILKDPAKAMKVAIGPAISAILLQGRAPDAVGFEGSDLSPEARAAVSRFLGADLAKEFFVTEEWLQKKTTAEIAAFIKKFSLHKNDAFVKAIKGNAEKAKKSELVQAVLAVGPALVGKVPDEILKEGKN